MNQQDGDSVEPTTPPAEVIYDIDKAPEPVRRMRQLIIDAATTGDILKLRPLMNPGPDQTSVPLQDARARPDRCAEGDFRRQ